MKKYFSCILVLLSVITICGCSKTNKTTNSLTNLNNQEKSFVIEFRKQVSGQDITGEIVKSYTIYYDSDDVYVIDAFTKNEDKCMLSDTDYFTTSSFGEAVGFNKGYIIGYNDNNEFDLSWSYSSYNGGYSSGLSLDKLDGLSTYTIVIDGWK